MLPTVFKISVTYGTPTMAYSVVFTFTICGCSGPTPHLQTCPGGTTGCRQSTIPPLEPQVSLLGTLYLQASPLRITGCKVVYYPSFRSSGGSIWHPSPTGLTFKDH